MAGNILHHIDAVSFQIHLCKKIDQEHNDAEHNRYNAHGDGHKLTAEFFGHIYLYAGAVFCEGCESNFKFGSTISSLWLRHTLTVEKSAYQCDFSTFYLQMVAHFTDSRDMDVGFYTG